MTTKLLSIDNILLHITTIIAKIESSPKGFIRTILLLLGVIIIFNVLQMVYSFFRRRIKREELIQQLTANMHEMEKDIDKLTGTAQNCFMIQEKQIKLLQEEVRYYRGLSHQIMEKSSHHLEIIKENQMDLFRTIDTLSQYLDHPDTEQEQQILNLLTIQEKSIQNAITFAKEYYDEQFQEQEPER